MALIGNRGFSRTASTVTRAATNKKITTHRTMPTMLQVGTLAGRAFASP